MLIDMKDEVSESWLSKEDELTDIDADDPIPEELVLYEPSQTGLQRIWGEHN